jgi:pyruvate,orthophosphate dikinase
MVFGNMGDTFARCVAFNAEILPRRVELYGEYLINAQGEDVGAGVRTPQQIETLKNVMPEADEQFLVIAKTLEDHYRDMQDMEYTIERGKLYMLQTRNGKRTAAAALKIAVDLVAEGMLTKERGHHEGLAQTARRAFASAVRSKALKSATPLRRACRRRPARPAAAFSSTRRTPRAAASEAGS